MSPLKNRSDRLAQKREQKVIMVQRLNRLTPRQCSLPALRIWQQKQMDPYVGDRFQQACTFRGAVNAMDTVLTPDTSYLTQSWRFGPNITRFASDIIGHLGAPKPLLGNPDIKDALRVLGDDRRRQQDKETVAVLCRTNAELISEYVYLLSKHKPPHIVEATGVRGPGRDWRLHKALE